MSMSFGEGVALGMISADAHRSTRRYRNAEDRCYELEQQISKLQNEIKELKHSRLVAVRVATAGNIVSFWAGKALKSLPPEKCKELQDFIIGNSLKRMDFLDIEYKEDARKGGYRHVGVFDAYMLHTDPLELGFKPRNK